MPRRTRITPELLAEVKRRRGSGECWKAISRDLATRGLPSGRTRWFLALRDVHEPPAACGNADEPCTQT